MTQIRIDPADGSAESVIPSISSAIIEELQKQWTATATVDRTELNTANPKEGLDTVYIEEDNGDRLFGGVLRDISRGGGTTAKLKLDSFERKAREAEPLPARTRFEDVDDTTIISDAIGRVSSLSSGTVNNIKSNLTFTFSHVSPAKEMRVVSNVTGASLIYNADETVDYIEQPGSDKTTTTLSPKNRLVESFNLRRDGGTKRVNHLRALGGGTGDAQTVVSVTASDYEAGDEKVWGTYTNKELQNSNTLREEAQELVNEMSQSYIEATITVRGVDMNIGDSFFVRYPEQNVAYSGQVVKLKTIRDVDGERYKATISTRDLTRYATSEKVTQDVQRFNRSSAERVISTYDNPTNAPQEEGNIIYVTGANASYEKGIYYHNGSNYEGTQYSDVDSQHVYASDSFVAPVGTDESGLMVLPVGTDKYDTT